METAQTADYALRVLLELERQDEQTVTDLARNLALDRAVVQRIVATLHRRTLVLKTINGRYVLGPGLLILGNGIQHELARIARLPMLALSESTQEMVILTAPDGDEAEVIAERSGNRGPLRIEYSLGFRHPLSRGASGLAILAFMDSKVAKRLCSARDLDRLKQIREAGYALTEGEIRKFMVGMAVPVHSPGNGVIGSLAVVAPTARANNMEAFLPEMLATARELGSEYARVYGQRVNKEVG